MNSMVKNFVTVVAILVGDVASAQKIQNVGFQKNDFGIVNGMEIWQISDESQYIQVADKSFPVYEMSYKEWIAKEDSVAQLSSNESSSSRVQHIKSGYRGFVDLSYTLGVGTFGVDRIEISTSHGYQINPYIFIGAGTGLNVFYDDGGHAYVIPVFAHARSECLNSAISPFFDFKIGYSFLDTDGLYCCPSVGCRFQVSNTIGLNVSVGYTYQRLTSSQNLSFLYNGDAETCGGISAKIGIDF